MPRLYHLVTLLAAVFLLAHCSDGGVSKQTPPQPPPEQPQEAVASPLIGAKGELLTVRKDALGKEFLLQGSIAMQRDYGDHVSNPTSEGLKSRIVVFQEQGDKLLLIEANEGFQPGTELPAHALITTFPIKDDSNGAITFDFNEGMTNAVISWDWYVSDYDGEVIYPNWALEVASSYVRDVKADEDGVVIIHTMSVKDRVYLVPLEITYYLTPYKANPNYVPVESPGFDYLGYFEANPLVQKDFGTPFTYVTRWDISKPITYYLSSAIPEEYRDAVREGVLFWNKVFGNEVLKVETAPEGVTAPDFKHNIIQWHTDHDAGYAYADAQVDPRTGEILHAQVFIPSAFPEWYRAYLIPVLDRKLGEDNKAPTFLAARQVDGARLCNLSLADLFGDLYLHRDAVNGLSPERIMTVTKDLIRWTVAHEVGHTLGLRHNFAASAVNEWTGEEETKNLHNYLQKGEIAKGLLINSLMEYPNITARMLVGAVIAAPDAQPLPYDQYAIQWGYFKYAQDPAFEGHPFCTDSHIGEFEDCKQGDAGRHIVERRAFVSMDSFEKIPWLLSEAYLNAKADLNPRFRKPIEESTPSARYLAYSVIGPLQYLIYPLTHEISLLSIERKDPDLTDIDKERISKDTLAWLNSEIAYAGGVENVLGLTEMFESVIQSWQAEFDRIVASDTYRNAPLPEGGVVNFTDEEVAYMRKRAGELFPKVEEELVSGITAVLQTGIFKPIDSVEEIEAALAHWAESVLLAQGTVFALAIPGLGSEYLYRYPIEVRRNAVNLLKSDGPFPDWLATYIQPIADKWREQLEAVLGMKLEDVKPELFPRAERQRIMDEIALYYSLAGKTTSNSGADGGKLVAKPDHFYEGAGALRWLKMLF